MRALRTVDRVAAESRARGSSEMMLAILLTAGASSGRELARNIIKLQSEVGLSRALDAAWNTAFDLTYTRLAVVLPLYGRLPAPVVLMTVAKQLSTFLNSIDPMGGARGTNGVATPVGASDLEGLVGDELFEDIEKVMLTSMNATTNSTPPIEQVEVIRHVNAKRHVERLERNFEKCYQPVPGG